uniref:Uncharacterized protein n=1 Tax=Cacopsylla melanoneura TaxID=428564 RepID=A0A8D8QBH3_9HEMI
MVFFSVEKDLESYNKHFICKLKSLNTLFAKRELESSTKGSTNIIFVKRPKENLEVVLKYLQFYMYNHHICPNIFGHLKVPLKSLRNHPIFSNRAEKVFLSFKPLKQKCQKVILGYQIYFSLFPALYWKQWVHLLLDLPTWLMWSV